MAQLLNRDKFSCLRAHQIVERREGTAGEEDAAGGLLENSRVYRSLVIARGRKGGSPIVQYKTSCS